MGRWIKYNPNPKRNTTDDCTIRALARATCRDWDEPESWDRVYAALCEIGFYHKFMPSTDYIWNIYLSEHGFVRRWVDTRGYDDYTVRDFCRDHPYGVYVLCMPAKMGHVVCAVDGQYYDNWDSGDEVPTYYWERER